MFVFKIKKREKDKLQRNQEKDAKNLQVKLALLKIEQKKEKELLQNKKETTDLRDDNHIANEDNKEISSKSGLEEWQKNYTVFPERFN